jgi:hypothetical protein
MFLFGRRYLGLVASLAPLIDTQNETLGAGVPF